MHFEKLCNENINFFLQLFEDGRIISWVNLKGEFELTNDMFLVVSAKIGNFYKKVNTSL